MALNHMCFNALDHVGDVLTYLSMLREPSVFRFCAIPQVMAISTLAECYNNPKLFKCVVKIRKGLAVKMIQRASNMTQTYEIFYQFLSILREKATKEVASLLRWSSEIPKDRAALQFQSVEIQLKLIQKCTEYMNQCALNLPKDRLIELQPTRSIPQVQPVLLSASLILTPIVAWYFASR